MDTPPPLPPPLPVVITPEDEKLLKRASDAGRNLAVLASLASFAAFAFLAVALFDKKAPAFMSIMGGTMALIAAGYWVLMLAARRGNPNAVGVVMVAMGLQLCLVLIAAGVVAALKKGSYQMPTGGLIIPGLVLFALAGSRKVLLDLKQRQLWDRVFGAAKPSGSLCLIGGAFLAAGFISMNAGTTYVAWKAGEQQAAEFGHARSFLELIKGEEHEFLAAMQEISTPRGIDTALAKFKTLEERFHVIKKESAGASRLQQILATYEGALRQWNNGLMLLQERDPDIERVQKMLKLGDKLRADAAEEFDRRYVAKKP